MSKKPFNSANSQKSRAKSSNRLNYIVPKSFYNPVIQKNEDGEYAPAG